MDDYSKGDVLSNQLIAKTGERLAKKYNMSISGIGGGEEDQGIWLIRVMFNRKGNLLTISEGRKIILDCIQEFLFDINHDEELRPYLKVYPFTAANLYITIINYTPEGYVVEDPYLEVISGNKGEIAYRTLDPNDHFKYKSSIYETYDEAVAILTQEPGS
jgi:hypothetical protein